MTPGDKAGAGKGDHFPQAPPKFSSFPWSGGNELHPGVRPAGLVALSINSKTIYQSGLVY